MIDTNLKVKPLPINESEVELEKLMLECEVLKKRLKTNIESLLESFTEVTKYDHYSSERAKNPEGQGRSSG